MAASTATGFDGDLNLMKRQVCRPLPHYSSLVRTRRRQCFDNSLYLGRHACMPAVLFRSTVTGSTTVFLPRLFLASKAGHVRRRESVECGSCWVRCDESSSGLLTSIIARCKVREILGVGHICYAYISFKLQESSREAEAEEEEEKKTRVSAVDCVFFTNILALEGGLMSQERPFENSDTEHRPELNHSQPTEEVTTAASTPNHFSRMMTDQGFPSPTSNPAPFVVTTEAFLGLTSQVQAVADMVQTIVQYLSQLIHSVTHQSAPLMIFPQTESPIATNRETPLEAEPPQRQVTKAHAASPTPAPARSQSRSCDPVQTSPNLDTLSSDTADSMREQVRQVHQRLDEVQKEVLKSRGEMEESPKDGSPFTPEIQGKPLSATFRLPILEPYDSPHRSKEFQTFIHP
ncbi:hypothetical protein B296_00001951 [Ensete ventricosum]|uniref:Uncharacterized protein n=1 Tax=Ensete ventricosum TaxID=4639 RepID=A0A427A388_ENSVE|nr:hypothetical protein B296_00001951 [Ensete ventricosum]